MILRIFFLIFLPYLAIAEQQIAFFHLDNQTLAHEEELTRDPFLVLRTKASPRQASYSLEDAINLLFQKQIPAIEPLQFKEESALLVEIANLHNTFYYESPYFELQCNFESPEHVWWQISADPSFEQNPSNLDQIEPYSPRILLSAIAETFINPRQPYYFRAKAIKGEKSSPWSETFIFFVEKPAQIQNIEFKKISAGKFAISWEKDASASAEYLIFASNSHDFIPSLYHDKQIEAITSSGEVATSPNYNLIGKTASTNLEVDGTFAYYRVIAIDQGQLGVPSELIYVYGNDLVQQRDHLALTDDGIQRVSFPSSNAFHCLAKALKNYTTHPYISAETWQKVTPYLLPENHPALPFLDMMFGSERVSQSILSMQKAGFKTKGGPHHHSKTIFGKHKHLKGYIVKIIPDDFDADEVTRLLSRIHGAQTVQEIIDRHGYHKLVKVPKKWLYVLPPEPSPSPGTNRKNFILVAEDMNIYPREENYPIWRSFFMTPERLHAIYTIVTEGGMNDSVMAFNIPFSKKDGKTCFIDTEDHHKWPIPYKTLNKYLSPAMQEYWMSLAYPAK